MSVFETKAEMSTGCVHQNLDGTWFFIWGEESISFVTREQAEQALELFVLSIEYRSMLNTDKDPIVRKIDGWYYYMENWVVTVGPFSTEHEAELKFAEYCNSFLRKE